MAKYKIKAWSDYFEDSGLEPDRIALYMEYVRNSYKEGVPPIFEFRHLAYLLGLRMGHLASIVNSPERHYRQFVIPKRKGGKRAICAPYPALLESQRWINLNILSRVKTHRVAHGFKPKKSILSNSRQHLNKKCILIMDLKDFFPSIKLPRVISIFRNLGYPSNVAYYLAKICCYDNSLPQGAPTSPYISNIVARKMDTRFYGLCRKSGLKYTRYADDLAFSGDYISPKIRALIKTIIEDEGFVSNAKKTRLCRRKRIVTGISVSNENPKLPRDKKRSLKQEVYFIKKYGLASHMRKNNIRDPFYIYSLYGKLSFWKWVEPDNIFLEENLSIMRSKFLS